MPNGGSEHCGNCRHNRADFSRLAARDASAPAFCTVRNVEVPAAISSICANHYRDLKKPLGPIFASLGVDDRVPYHDDARPRSRETARCRICGAASRGYLGVELAHPTLGKLQFCGAAHYAHWWKQAHPGAALLWDCDAPPPSQEQVTAREAAALLDLARAYLGIGDREGAREVLTEASRIATGAQHDEAEGLLASLAR